jgi:hypothetical protein
MDLKRHSALKPTAFSVNAKPTARGQVVRPSHPKPRVFPQISQITTDSEGRKVPPSREIAAASGFQSVNICAISLPPIRSADVKALKVPRRDSETFWTSCRLQRGVSETLGEVPESPLTIGAPSIHDNEVVNTITRLPVLVPSEQSANGSRFARGDEFLRGSWPSRSGSREASARAVAQRRPTGAQDSM